MAYDTIPSQVQIISEIKDGKYIITFKRINFAKNVEMMELVRNDAKRKLNYRISLKFQMVFVNQNRLKLYSS